MTLQASGPISMSDINGELRLPSNTPISLNDAQVRALGDTPSGGISMSNFYSQQAVKLAGFASGGLATSHNINVGFGNAYPSRRLHVWIFVTGKASGADPGESTTLTNVVIGGVPVANMELTAWFDSVGGTDFAGVATESAIVPAGTSGNISFNSPIGLVPYVVVAAIANASLSAFSFGNTGGTGLNMSVAVPANGVFLAGAVRHNTNDIAWAGITERYEAIVSGYRVSVGWLNRVSDTQNANFSSSGNASTAGCIDSYG